MSDSIDRTDPSVPKPAYEPEPADQPTAPPAAPDDDHSTELDATSTPSVFTTGFESPGELPMADPFADRLPVRPSVEPTHSVEAAQPVEPTLSMEPPSVAETPTAQPTNRPSIESYRPSPPIERAVRPLEPFATATPSSAAAGTASTAAPTGVARVTPPERTHYYPAPQSEQPPPQLRRWPLVLLAFGSGLLGALLVLGGLFLGGIFDDDSPAATTTAAPVAITAPPETIVVREVIAPEGSEGIATAVGQKVVPSVVTIEVGTGVATSIDFSPFGSGSGVVFSADGLILTNHHVIAGAETSRVIFQDGRIYEATIIGSDELTDLAVLQIDATGLIPIEFGATEGLRIGDRAIAVGNPLGLQGGASLTVGVVSAFDREVDTGDGTPLFGMLQTDAPITNGSSGGALVNAEGKLIGITTAIGVSQSGAEGIGFATPVEVVRRISDQILETGTVSHAFLGVRLRTNFGIQPDGAAVPEGAIVEDFGEGESAAEAAGLEPGDIIISWNSNRVRTTNDLINGIRASAVGDEIELVVERGTETLTFTVVLGERPEGV